MTQVTVISGVEQRRVWIDEQKLPLVEVSMKPGANVAKIARLADVRPAQIYRWRQELLDPRSKPPSGFAPVVIAPASLTVPMAPSSTVAAIIIEVEGAIVKIASDAPPALVTAALHGLKR